MKQKGIRKQITAVFAVIFNNQGQILLSQRNDYDRRAHLHMKWQLVGGGVEFGEDPVNALHREVQEEVGVKIKALTDTPFVYSILLNKTTHAVFLGYPALYISGEIDTTHDEETHSAKWFEYRNIDWNNVIPETPVFLNKAVDYVNKNNLLGKRI